jgi:hypothetical protein
MKGFSTELLYGLGVAAIVLFQYLRRHFRTRPQPKTETATENAEPALEKTPVGSTSADRQLPAKRIAATGSLVSSGNPCVACRSLLRSKHAVRNAIVNAIILGPCRAFDPPD